MRFAVVVGALAALSFPALAQQAQPSAIEMNAALSMKAQVLQRDLDDAYLTIAKQNAALAEEEARLKWVLDNWVPKSPPVRK